MIETTTIDQLKKEEKDKRTTSQFYVHVSVSPFIVNFL